MTVIAVVFKLSVIIGSEKDSVRRPVSMSKSKSLRRGLAVSNMKRDGMKPGDTC